MFFYCVIPTKYNVPLKRIIFFLEKIAEPHSPFQELLNEIARLGMDLFGLKDTREEI